VIADLGVVFAVSVLFDETDPFRALGTTSWFPSSLADVPRSPCGRGLRRDVVVPRQRRLDRARGGRRRLGAVEILG